jgi:hypothetical protein
MPLSVDRLRETLSEDVHAFVVGKFASRDHNPNWVTNWNPPIGPVRKVSTVPSIGEM